LLSIGKFRPVPSIEHDVVEICKSEVQIPVQV